jgi:hypothetical protein
MMIVVVVVVEKVKTMRRLKEHQQLMVVKAKVWVRKKDIKLADEALIETDHQVDLELMEAAYHQSKVAGCKKKVWGLSHQLLSTCCYSDSGQKLVVVYQPSFVYHCSLSSV